MQVYRETRELDRPAALVRATLDDFAGGDADGDATAPPTERWRAVRGPYRTTATLDAATGELRVSVALPAAYGPLAAGLLGLVLAGLAVDAPAWTFLPALWTGAALTLLPVGHLLVGPLPDADGLRTVDRGLSAAVLAPYAAAALALFGALRGMLGPEAAAAPVAMLASVGAGAYLLAGTGRRVTALDVPLSVLLAPLVAATNLLVAGALLEDPASPALAVGLAAAVALVLGALFPCYCRVALRRFADARLAPVARRYRVLAAVGHVGLTLALAASVAFGLRAVLVGPGADGPLPPPVDALVPARATVRAAVGAGTAGDIAVAGLSLLLVAPLAWLVVGWIAHLLGSLGARTLALVRSAPLSIAEPSVPVRVVRTDRPLIRPVAVPGVWWGVLVGRPVVEALTDDELRAVVAHEASHLEGRDLTAAAAASLAGLGFGGRNALLAFYDYAAAERAADEHAARTVGPDALVRALRRLEGLRSSGAGMAVADGEPAAGSAGATGERGTISPLRRVARAPYDLLFGRVLLDAAHRSVDERIRHVRRLAGEG
jgi:Zn-dependent protease with chaperone function